MNEAEAWEDITLRLLPSIVFSPVSSSYPSSLLPIPPTIPTSHFLLFLALSCVSSLALDCLLLLSFYVCAIPMCDCEAPFSAKVPQLTSRLL